MTEECEPVRFVFVDQSTADLWVVTQSGEVGLLHAPLGDTPTKVRPLLKRQSKDRMRIVACLRINVVKRVSPRGELKTMRHTQQVSVLVNRLLQKVVESVATTFTAQRLRLMIWGVDRLLRERGRSQGGIL